MKGRQCPRCGGNGGDQGPISAHAWPGLGRQGLSARTGGSQEEAHSPLIGNARRSVCGARRDVRSHSRSIIAAPGSPLRTRWATSSASCMATDAGLDRARRRAGAPAPLAGRGRWLTAPCRCSAGRCACAGAGAAASARATMVARNSAADCRRSAAGCCVRYARVGLVPRAGRGVPPSTRDSMPADAVVEARRTRWGSRPRSLRDPPALAADPPERR